MDVIWWATIIIISTVNEFCVKSRHYIINRFSYSANMRNFLRITISSRQLQFQFNMKGTIHIKYKLRLQFYLLLFPRVYHLTCNTFIILTFPRNLVCIGTYQRKLLNASSHDKQFWNVDFSLLSTEVILSTGLGWNFIFNFSFLRYVVFNFFSHM